MDCSPPGSSVGFSRQEYWPFPSPGALSNPEMEPESPELQANSLPSEPQGKPYPYINPCNCDTCQIFTLLQKFPWCSFAANPIVSIPSQVSIYLTPSHRLVLPVLEQLYLSWKESLSLLFLFLGCAEQHVGSQFPDQGLNLLPLQCSAWSLNHWTAREVPGVTL